MGQGNIIGYEINEKTCQISFYNEEMAEPETMEVDADIIRSLWSSESCVIPGHTEKKQNVWPARKKDSP